MKNTINIALLACISLTIFLIVQTNHRVESIAPLSSPLATTPISSAAPPLETASRVTDTLSPTPTSSPSTTIDSQSSSTTSETSPSSHVQIKAIPAISQLPELPNGCEAVAATMLLNWAGLPITKEEVANALPKGEMPSENEYGAFVGANPRDVFVGDPFDIGYGIYHTPIAILMNQWLPGHIRDLTGTSFDDLLGVITQGKPAMIWATEHMDIPYLDLEWQDEDDELVEWYQPEHALLLTGWDNEYAYMNDPMTGAQEAYPLGTFKEVWEMMGSQAITIIS